MLFALPFTGKAISYGDLIKASNPSVYFYGQDSKRHAFPNEKNFFTWYQNYDSITTIKDQELAGIVLGGNITYRPGVKMIKIDSDPKVYAVSQGGVLRWVKTETVARELYGSDWNTLIDDISPAFFVNYRIGSDIESIMDYSPAREMFLADSIIINGDVVLSLEDKSASVSSSKDSIPQPAFVEPILKVDIGPVTGNNRADISAPFVTISAPTVDQIITGSVTFSANASDDGMVRGVRFLVNETDIGLEDIGAPFSISWDTTTVIDGTHTLTAIARDSVGNTRISSPVTVTVDNNAPTVSISAPADTSTVTGSTAVSATASDTVGVSSVQFKLDGSDLGAADTVAPYSIDWDSTAAADGSHSLTAVASDAAGNTQVSSAITVTVDNTGPIISSISSGTPGLTAATITWSTNETSDSQINYGLTSAYGTTSTLDSTQVTSHSVTISGLSEGTLYNFRVRSSDAQGNLTISDNQTLTTSYYGSSAAAGQGFDSYASVLSLVSDGDDLLIRDAATPANNYSGVPYSKFTAGSGIKYTFASNGYLKKQNYLFQTHVTSSSVNLPDAQGGDAGEGFTSTGAAWDGSAFWLGNDGGNVSGDSSRLPSIVRVSLAGAKLDEIDIGTLYSDFTSIQGVAWDSSDSTLWVAQVSAGQVRHVTTGGTDVGDGFALAGVNGLAYDSSRDRLWALAGTTLTLRQKDGTVDATYSVAALSDQLFYDADRDYIWVTNGANGSVGNANAYDASDGSLVGTASFSDATAIEGLVINDGNFYVFHDGYYHAADGAIIQKNQIQVYSAVEGSANIAWAIEHDPLNSNAVLGYPFESAFGRLNSVPKDFDNIQWSKPNVTISANSITSPTGEQDAETFTANAGTGVRYVTRVVSVSAAQYVSTVIVKAGTHDYIWLGDRGDTGGIHSASYNLSAGTVIGQSNATGYIRALGNGWYRIELRFTRNNATTAGISMAFGAAAHSTDWPSATFVGTETLYVFAAEIGHGSFGTSPVLNSSGVETRVADSPIIATSQFNFSATENTFVFEGSTARGMGTSTQVLFQADDGTSDERYRIERDTSNELHFIVTDGGVEQADLNFGVVAHNTSFKVAIRAQSDDFAGSLDGGLVVTDTGGTLPTVTTFRLGHSDSGEQWSAPVFSAVSISSGLDDATLQNLSTP